MKAKFFLRNIGYRIRSITFFLSRKIHNLFYFNRCRRRNKNSDFTIIAPNCYAGIMYHRLGMQFLSPTINCFFLYRKQYLDFCCNLKDYLNKDIKIAYRDLLGRPVPVGDLNGITIVFNHYKTVEEAYDKWNQRKKRVNYDNLYFIFDDIDDVEYEDLVRFNQIECKAKVIFTAKEYKDLKNTVIVQKFAKQGKLEHYLEFTNPYTGKFPTDKDFDFVKWLN